MLFGTPRIKEELGSQRYSLPESTIANRNCQKTTGFISFLEHRKSKMSKNERFFKLFGTLETKNVKKTLGFVCFLEHRLHHHHLHRMEPPL